MEDVISLINGLLNANSGAVEYSTLLDSVPFERRRYLMPAIRQMEADGTARRQIRLGENGKPVHEIVKG